MCYKPTFKIKSGTVQQKPLLAIGNVQVEDRQRAGRVGNRTLEASSDVLYLLFDHKERVFVSHVIEPAHCLANLILFGANFRDVFGWQFQSQVGILTLQKNSQCCLNDHRVFAVRQTLAYLSKSTDF